MNDMVFDNPKPKELRVTINWPEGQKNYIVYECDEGDAAAYKNSQAQALRISADGSKPTTLQNPADARSFLLSRCMFEVMNESEPYREVMLTTIRGIPGKQQGMRPEIVAKLFKWIKDNSPGLDDDPTLDMVDKEIAILQRKREQLLAGMTIEERAKNSQGDGTATSS